MGGGIQPDELVGRAFGEEIDPGPRKAGFHGVRRGKGEEDVPHPSKLYDEDFFRIGFHGLEKSYYSFFDASR